LSSARTDDGLESMEQAGPEESSDIDAMVADLLKVLLARINPFWCSLHRYGIMGKLLTVVGGSVVCQESRRSIHSVLGSTTGVVETEESMDGMFD